MGEAFSLLPLYWGIDWYDELPLSESLESVASKYNVTASPLARADRTGLVAAIAVVAAVVALLVSVFIYRGMTLSDLPHILLASAKTASSIMLIVAASMVSAWLITIADIPAQVTDMMAPFMDNKLLLMIILMILVFAVGTALDLAPTVLILTPVLMPLVKAAGIDPYYFGIMFMMNNAIGLITPPVGTVLNVVSSVARVNLDTVIKGMFPFLIAETLVMFLLVAFPQLVTVPARWFY